MSLNLIPDFRFNKFNDLTLNFFISNGFKGIVLDIDNTLEPYEHDKPGQHVIEWLKMLSDNGIKAAFVSNNNKKRLDLFNSELNLPAFYYSKKPFKKNILRAMKMIGTDVSNTVLMGDQVFTDVWGAHNAGIKAVLVPPINDKRDAFTRFKRWLEKPILRKYDKKRKIN